MLPHQFEDLEFNLIKEVLPGREPLSNIQDTQMGKQPRAYMAKKEDAENHHAVTKMIPLLGSYSSSIFFTSCKD